MAGTAALPPLPVDSDMETVTLMRSVLDPSCVETTTVRPGTISWTAARRGNFATQKTMTGTAALPPLPVDSDMETVTMMRSVLDPSCVETITVKQGTTGWTAARRGNFANQRMTGTAAPRSVRSN